MMRAKSRVYFIGFILLAFIIGYFSHVKAVAKESYFSVETDEAEIEFRKEIKEVLKNYGAKSAGITMTKTCEDGHHLDYEVKINLPGYISAADEKLAKTEIMALCLMVPDCDVTFYFAGKED